MSSDDNKKVGKKQTKKEGEKKKPKKQKTEEDELRDSIKGQRDKIRSTIKVDTDLKEYANKNDISYNSLSKMKVRRTLKGHSAKVYGFDFCKTNPKYIVSASQDGKLIVWNFFSTHKLYVIILKCAWVLACAYSPNGKGVVSGGLDNTIYYYKLGEEEVPDDPEEYKGHDQCINSLKFVDDDSLLSTSGDTTIMLWDVEEKKNKATFTGHDQDVICIDVAEDKNTFVTGSIDTTAMLWDIRTGKASLSFSGNDKDINSIKYFPNQQAFATGSDDGIVKLYDIRGDREFMVYDHSNGEGNGPKINSLDFSKSGKFLFTATENVVNIWNTLSGENTIRLNEGNDVVSGVGVNPTGEAVITSNWNGTLKFYA